MPATMIATAPLARIFSLLGVLACALFLGACAGGPDYVRPAMDLPVAYKEQGPWKIATPGRIDSRQRWWEAYQDAVLSDLIYQENRANQNLRLPKEHHRQAQAAAAIA